ncbi:MAG: hypothetical protein AUH46_04515 [Gemmatimonadetes bacterium 13_1_40CM_70_15]|nr:MAG: hypothetical protein AUH46_04515 [Gemmatimonadetes bacterium 13_1_40CM_70_15]
MRRLTRLLLLATAAVAARRIAAQGRFPPDSFTNLKVLPKNIDQRTLIATMRGFALALGVRCTYCHVGREGAPLDSLSFAKDDKRTKKVARVMMHMVMHINDEHLHDVPDRPKPLLEVRCATFASTFPSTAFIVTTVRDSTFGPARMRLRQLTRWGGGQSPP